METTSSSVEQYGHLKLRSPFATLGTSRTLNELFPPLTEDAYSVLGRPENVAASFKSDLATVEKLCLVVCVGLETADFEPSFSMTSDGFDDEGLGLATGSFGTFGPVGRLRADG